MKKNKQKLIFQSKVEFAEGKPPKEIQILPTGKWDHPSYGVISITPDDIIEFKENFDKKIRKDIPITQGHESFDEKPAVGWFTKVDDRGEQGLWGQVDWNETGKTALKQKAFKYFSPEFHQFYEDPETREEYKNVLVGGALTNKPYFKELKAVVFSDKDLISLSDDNMELELKDLLKKDVAELTDEEKVFINEHKDELSEDEATKFESVIETDDDADVDDDKDDDNKDDDKDDNKDDDKKEASESVSGAALIKLREDADKGALAFAELNKMKLNESVSKLMFSETNKTGKILPKNEKTLRAFMETLNDGQRAKFAEIINAIPSSKVFNELGEENAAVSSAKAQVETKVKAMMSEDKDLGYSDAIVKLFAEDADLAKRYEKEMAS